MQRNEHRNLANMSVTACCVCGANYWKYSVAWILSPCHKSLTKVFTGTMGMVVSVYAPINVSYSAPNKDTWLLLVPLRSKCCQLDVPFLMNWAFAQQLGVLIPQRVIMTSVSVTFVTHIIPSDKFKVYKSISYLSRKTTKYLGPMPLCNI